MDSIVLQMRICSVWARHGRKGFWFCHSTDHSILFVHFRSCCGAKVNPKIHLLLVCWLEPNKTLDDGLMPLEVESDVIAIVNVAKQNDGGEGDGVSMGGHDEETMVEVDQGKSTMGVSASKVMITHAKTVVHKIIIMEDKNEEANNIVDEEAIEVGEIGHNKQTCPIAKQKRMEDMLAKKKEEAKKEEETNKDEVRAKTQGLVQYVEPITTDEIEPFGSQPIIQPVIITSVRRSSRLKNPLSSSPPVVTSIVRRSPMLTIPLNSFPPATLIASNQ
ncbi:hypothetical protein RJT34_03757 [Clitoria ternatea]|uniref:Uncharacterized protein n=1 Tax=Clitoria ternatea TaxID=43366 RepID=A0AAN9KKD2_CLITE